MGEEDEEVEGRQHKVALIMAAGGRCGSWRKSLGGGAMVGRTELP